MRGPMLVVVAVMLLSFRPPCWLPPPRQRRRRRDFPASTGSQRLRWGWLVSRGDIRRLGLMDERRRCVRRRAADVPQHAVHNRDGLRRELPAPVSGSREASSSLLRELADHRWDRCVRDAARPGHMDRRPSAGYHPRAVHADRQRPFRL